jgi:hypothetical protein
LAVALAFASAVLGADDAPPVPKPEVTVGDRWTSRVTTHKTNVPKTTITESRVTFVGPDLIATVDTDGSGKENDSQYTSEWAVMASSNGRVFNPPIRIFRFPLKVGDSYPFAFEMVSARDTANRWKSEGEVKVVGWEEVVVPAGRFRALKIEAKNTYRGLTGNFFGWARRDIWYVPEVKRTAKFIYQDGAHGRSAPDNKIEIELTGFKVQ